LLLSQSLRLTDGGVERDYVIATDEVHLSGPKLDRVVRVDELGTAKSLRAPGTRLETVLYPAGEPRSNGRRRIITRRVSAKVSPGTDIGALATQVQAVSFETMAFDGSLAVFHTGESSGLALAARLREHPEVLRAEVILGRYLTPKVQPNDPLLPRQWTLKNTGQSGGTPGADANVFPVWESGRHGEDVVISIVDDGVEALTPTSRTALYLKPATITGTRIRSQNPREPTESMQRANQRPTPMEPRSPAWLPPVVTMA
jgi:hypothetical protein